MPNFNPSVTLPLPFKPWRWTTPPVYGNGPMNPPTVAGVKEEKQGAFILVSDEILDFMMSKLSASEDAELLSMVVRFSDQTPLPAGHLSAGEWNVPVWGIGVPAVYIQVPQAIMNGPGAAVPAKVARFFDKYYS